MVGMFTVDDGKNAVEFPVDVLGYPGDAFGELFDRFYCCGISTLCWSRGIFVVFLI